MNSDPLQPSGQRDIPFGHPTVQSIIRPDDENFPSGPSSLLRSFDLFQLASVRTFYQHIRAPLSIRSAMGFLSKTQIWEDSCNRPEDVDSRPNALIHKEVAHSKFIRPDDGLHGPDTRASYMEIGYIRFTVRTRQALIWKLHAAKVRPSGR